MYLVAISQTVYLEFGKKESFLSFVVNYGLKHKNLNNGQKFWFSKKCCPRTTLLPQDFIYLYFISIRRWNFSFEHQRNPNFIEKISQNDSHIFIIVWLHDETKFCKVPLQWNISSKKSHLFCRIKRLELVLKDICCLKTNDNPKTTDNVRRLARIFHFERLLMTDNFGNFLSCIHLFSFMYILPTFIHAKFV